MESFSHKLKQITFKTFYRNQLVTFDYDNLFSNRRVLIFSISNTHTKCTASHIQSFESTYQRFLSLGLDNVYAIDPVDWLVGPMMDKRNPEICGLPDRNFEFGQLVADLVGRTENVQDLYPWWQYVIIVTNGEPEKCWSSPFKKNVSLSIQKRFLRYHGLNIDNIEKYLIDTRQ